jgi:tetratricopeptide (TPR) repeat protein
MLPPSSCDVLITSRRKFALPGLIVLDLDVFSQDEAVEFLSNVYKPNSSPDEHKDEREVWNEIARLCGRLPLALRTAGSLLANTQDLRPSQYVKELGDELGRLERLGNEGVDLDVRASFNLSYVRLSPKTARVFQKISVFPADFDYRAEEYICEDKDHTHLSELVRWSFVEFKKEEGRYHLHDLVRLFAAEKLEDEGGKAGRNDAFQRHAEYFRDVLSLATEIYENGDALAGLRRFDLERINIEAGWAWAKRNLASNNTAASICNAILDRPYLLELRMHPQERISWLKTALSAARQLKNNRMEGVHLGNLGLAFAALGDARKAIEYYEQALMISREIGDRRGEGKRLGNLGLAYFHLGETRKAIEYYEQALKISREIRDRRGEGKRLGNLGLAYSDLGETHKAIEYHEQALRISREIGDRSGEAADLGNLGRAYSDLGETRKAIELYEQSLAISREIGDRICEGYALFNMSLAFYELDERDHGIDFAKSALETFEQIKSPVANQVRHQLAEWLRR